jgi:hypothetical protein
MVIYHHNSFCFCFTRNFHKKKCYCIFLKPIKIQHIFIDPKSNEEDTFSGHDESNFEDLIKDRDNQEGKALALEDVYVNDFILAPFYTKKNYTFLCWSD